MAGYNSTGVFTASICEKVLMGLENITQNGNLPNTKRSYLGYLDFVTSDLNKSNTEVIPVQNETKHKTVRIKYTNRVVESEVTEAEDGNCTPERYPDFLETTFDVDKVVSFNFGLKKREATLICSEGNQDLITRKMTEAFDAIARIINKRLLNVQLLNMGYNYGNSPASASTKSVNVLVAATGAPLATGIQTLDQDYYEKNQYSGTGAIIGAGNIMKYWKTIKTGCCNQDGVDMAAYAAELGWAPFLDTQLEGVFGSNQFLVLAPGLNQLVTLNRYVGENSGQFGTSMDTTVVDPRTGITYDMKIDYDGCNEAFYIRLTLNYGLWTQPVDVFNAGDPLYRTNGVSRYTAATT